jgi:subtilase family serine protease
VEQIRHQYGFDGVELDGAGEQIAIVTAFASPSLASDLSVFDYAMNVPSMFGLPGRPPCSPDRGPHPCFQVRAANKLIPAISEWALDQAADVEWAHAIAPKADLVVVEVSTPAMKSLIEAAASAAIEHASVVSMSWGIPESKVDRSIDRILEIPNVAFVAASGDSGHGVNYPAASSFVLAVGGTILNLQRDEGQSREVAWPSSSGGISSTEPAPDYQAKLTSGRGRGVPDVSLAVSPGYAVYSSSGGSKGWVSFQGTSIAAPQWAALVALLDQAAERRFTAPELAEKYLYPLVDAGDAVRPFRAVTGGTNGDCGDECSARNPYNLVTGLGTPLVPKLIAKVRKA